MNENELLITIINNFKMDKLNKDIISLIANELEDKDLFEFTKISKRGNRICDHEHSWMNRIIRYYPEAFKLKNKDINRKWKEYYLQIINYNEYNVNWGMKVAAEGGHRDLVEFFITKGANFWNSGMVFAARGGHKDLVEFFIEKGANDWGWVMMYGGGHKDLIDFFKQKIENENK